MGLREEEETKDRGLPAGVTYSWPEGPADPLRRGRMHVGEESPGWERSRCRAAQRWREREWGSPEEQCWEYSRDVPRS